MAMIPEAPLQKRTIALQSFQVGLCPVFCPHIAAIHGLEESDITHFPVLELIEDDTLSDRLKHGAIPVEESLKLALQIAEALEAAATIGSNLSC
jgi:hypothetical protein